MKLVIACFVASGLASSGAAQSPRVPVPLVAAEGYGPCSTAAVAGLTAPDALAAVRSGPSTRQRVLARLGNAANVFACVRRGDWFGIVFAPQGGPSDCGVTQPRRRNGIYSGPCRSGWIHERHLVGYADWVSP